MVAFRKNENAIAAVNGFSCESKAVAEASFTRKGKNVQKRHSQKPFDAIEYPEQRITRRWRPAQNFQGFSTGCGRELVAKAGGQSCKDKAHVYIINVVGNDQHRANHAAQILSALNSRPAQKKHRRLEQQIMHYEANPGDRPALCPTGIVVSRNPSRFSFQEAGEISDGVDRRE